ncbi:2-dehydro-3-deoxy-6-phosphogalactonate aldolase [Cognatishimia sp. 1_MG-2023]|uniref:2-dehydro-3-deoxy-6-phosphogalactonate aldolase n=1 Tax=Cognatishimia sp. 1_MG-2023 TaxID=3062642 RepID=UPI0026E46B1A|nr:2-dehydro-3-deoxy-6-phosphogalactonate aldolase [Cognatishimia sp. 1_MG-2023]MDO6727014.1 2-dehydro-3-deoxy-6-phosphogalactonate aldolase [Cognatishimia sp. 1_MG-2023]
MSREVIAILRGVKPDEVVGICAEILEAGIDRIEVPLNSPQPFDSIAMIAKEFGDRALIGAGTVLTPENVQRVKDAGGELIVSPDACVPVIEKTKELGMQSFPGVVTPTEAFSALRAGADGLKIFPGDLLGIAGLKALRAVLPPETPVYAVGGAGPENFADWAAAGATGFGIGSGIYKAGMTAAEVRVKADAIVAAYDKVMG